jgi:spore maturation protein CgeB
MGACLVTEHARNISELFEPQKEVVTYESTEDCVAKIRHLLSNPDEARQIAAAGHARTLKDHTVLNRCRAISAEIQALL